MIYIIGVVILALLARYLYRLKTSKNRCTADAEGILSHLDERTEMDRYSRKYVSYYVPIYEYRVRGIVYHAEVAEFSNNPASFKVKAGCSVKYNPEKPGECFVGGKKAKNVLEYREEDVYPKI